MNKYIIDRFEGSYAICEDEEKKFVNIERRLLPPNTKESDCIYTNDKGVFCIDYEATENNKMRIRSKLDSLFEE